jgi:D-tyrosyl-tRNA(Tyr) deacylase
MKVFVQRVSAGKCVVDGKTTGEIDQGYVCLVGFTHGDTLNEVKYCAKKVANLRVFSDQDDKLNLSVKDIQGDILSISQFTLYADTKKGNRPSFIDALDPEIATELYHEFNNELRQTHHLKVEEGVFGANMQISLTNDGPVSIMIESK